MPDGKCCWAKLSSVPPRTGTVGALPAHRDVPRGLASPAAGHDKNSQSPSWACWLE
jgi:hypothetical protein